MIKKLGGILLITGLLGGCALDQEDMKFEPKTEKSKHMEPEDDNNKAGTVKDFQLNEDGSYQEIEVDKNATPVDSMQQ